MHEQSVQFSVFAYPNKTIEMGHEIIKDAVSTGHMEKKTKIQTATSTGAFVCWLLFIHLVENIVNDNCLDFSFRFPGFKCIKMIHLNKPEFDM